MWATVLWGKEWTCGSFGPGNMQWGLLSRQGALQWPLLQGGTAGWTLSSSICWGQCPQRLWRSLATKALGVCGDKGRYDLPDLLSPPCGKVMLRASLLSLSCARLGEGDPGKLMSYAFPSSHRQVLCSTDSLQVLSFIRSSPSAVFICL